MRLMELQHESLGRVEEGDGPSADGSLPQSLTFDPTQGAGSKAWQLSVQHNLRNNAKERRN